MPANLTCRLRSSKLYQSPGLLQSGAWTWLVHSRRPLAATHICWWLSTKFTKWVEAKPIKKLAGATAANFLWGIISRFGISHSIITDNGTNLSQGKVEEYCSRHGIRLDLASVAHLQANGQVECTNGLVLQGPKPRLEVPLHRAARAWVEELQSVLWSLRTTPNRSTKLLLSS